MRNFMHHAAELWRFLPTWLGFPLRFSAILLALFGLTQSIDLLEAAFSGFWTRIAFLIAILAVVTGAFLVGTVWSLHTTEPGEFLRQANPTGVAGAGTC